MMLRPFPASPWEGLDVPSALLLGIQRESGPPVQVGPHRLQRLRIVIIDRDLPADDADFEENEEFGDEPEILPTLARWGGPIPPVRPVHGEILRSDDGALYERFGHRIRPLRGLAAGPRGEVLEIAATPAREEPSRGAKSPAAAPAQTPTPSPAPDPEPAPQPTASAVRALFAAPGHWRVVRFGDFRPTLLPQLEAPARLRDTHLLPCYVQIFEAAVGLARETLLHAVRSVTRAEGELVPVTPPLVQVLQLAALLPPPTRGVQRWVHLTPAHDPTQRENRAPETAAATETAPPIPMPPAAAPASPSVATAQAIAPPAAPAAAPAPVSTPVSVPALPPARKTEIPAAYAQSAAFVVSREAAYQDLLDDDRACASPLRRWLVRGKVAPEALRQWQQQMSGRPADEQLWAVPPPAGWRRDLDLRGWAARTLEAAGYDAALLSEWRLYWRRRGC